MRKGLGIWMVMVAGVGVSILSLAGDLQAKTKKAKAAEHEMAMPMSPSAQAKALSGTTQYMWPVPKDQICMVQKYDMEAKTTPVVLDGKTYYVCCEGCKNTITKDKNERFSKDPVSGKRINKADAVLGRASNGQIHFFESEQTRAAFRPTFTPVPSND
jgi:YHS domain-containing protein